MIKKSANTKSIRFGLGRMGLAAAGLLIATLNLSAESGLTTHIPFAFMASGKSLPAGDYSIQPIAPGVMLIAGADTSARALLLASSSSANASVPGLTFDRAGSIPQLTGVQSFMGTWQFMAPSGSKAGPTAAVALRSKK